MTDKKTWEQRVAAWRSSGLSARAFSEGRDYSVHMLRYWGRQVGPKPAALAPASRAAAPPVPRPAMPAVRMARVLRTGTTTPPPTASSAVVIEIGRARVAVAAGFDQPTLAAVLNLLGAEVGR